MSSKNNGKAQHVGTTSVVDGVSRIEVNIGGNVIDTLADFRAIPDNRPDLKMRHAIVGGLIGIGQQINEVRQAAMALHARLCDVEEILTALDHEGKLAVSDPGARMAIQRMQHGTFARKAAQAKGAGAEGEAGGETSEEPKA